MGLGFAQPSLRQLLVFETRVQLFGPSLSHFRDIFELHLMF